MYFGGVRKDFNCAILRRFWSALSRVNKTSTDIYEDIQTTLLGFMPCIKFRLITVIVRSDFYRAFQQCMFIRWWRSSRRAIICRERHLTNRMFGYKHFFYLCLEFVYNFLSNFIWHLTWINRWNIDIHCWNSETLYIKLENGWNMQLQSEFEKKRRERAPEKAKTKRFWKQQ